VETPTWLATPPHELPEPAPGWRSDPGRACVGKTPLYFAPRGVGSSLAKAADAVCAQCPVYASCRSWALLDADAAWRRIAMTSPADRRRYRKVHHVAAPRVLTVEAALRPILEGLRLRREQQAAG